MIRRRKVADRTLELPPNIQLLHCIHNTCQGGESRFADTFKAVDLLLPMLSRDDVELLCSRLNTYHYNKDGRNYIDSKAMLTMKPLWKRKIRLSAPKGTENPLLFDSMMSQIAAVYWSPPFLKQAAPYFGDETKQRAFLRITRAFAEILDGNELV